MANVAGRGLASGLLLTVRGGAVIVSEDARLRSEQLLSADIPEPPSNATGSGSIGNARRMSVEGCEISRDVANVAGRGRASGLLSTARGGAVMIQVLTRIRPDQLLSLVSPAAPPDAKV